MNFVLTIIGFVINHGFNKEGFKNIILMGSLSRFGKEVKYMQTNMITKSNSLDRCDNEDEGQSLSHGSLKTFFVAMSINLDMFKREEFLFPY